MYKKGPNESGWERDNWSTIYNAGTGKNVLSICSAGQASVIDTVYSIRSDSSKGPASDGRIKPDLCAFGEGGITVANGTRINSVVPELGGGYGTSSATSQATANVSGMLALLHQEFKLLQGNAQTPMPPALAKGLLIHTATDIDQNNGQRWDNGVVPAYTTRGPDYTTGWGWANPKAAVDHLRSRAYLRDTISHLTSKQYSVTLPLGTVPKFTLIWTDLPGTVGTSKALINDLDIVVSQSASPANITYYPWVLNKNSPMSAATTGINRVDNVEQVVIPAPAQSATYTVTVWATLPMGGAQEFYLLWNASATIQPSLLPPSLNGVSPSGTGTALSPSTSRDVQITGTVLFGASNKPDLVNLYHDAACSTLATNGTVNSVGSWRISMGMAGTAVTHAVIPVYAQSVRDSSPPLFSPCVKLFDYYYAMPSLVAPTLTQVMPTAGSAAAPSTQYQPQIAGSLASGSPRGDTVNLYGGAGCYPGFYLGGYLLAPGGTNWRVTLAGLGTGQSVSATVPIYGQAYLSSTGDISACVKLVDYYYAPAPAPTPTPTPPPSGSYTTVDDSDAGWSYGTDFDGYGDNHANLATLHGTDVPGNTATFAFTGTGIELYSWRGPDGGTVEIFVDNVSRGIVSQLNASDIYLQQIYKSPALPRGAHTLSVVKRTGDWVTIDYVRVAN